jgi:hypothetical protein
MPPVAAPLPAAPVNEPPAWPTTAVAPVVPAPPPAVPAAPPAATPADTASVQPVDSAPPPAAEVSLPPRDAPKHLPARTTGVARNAEFAEESSHVPALLGAVSALVIIIIGSFAGRLLTQRPRSRQPAKVRPRDWESRDSSVEDEAPGIVPMLPADAAHESPANVEALASPDDWGLRRAHAPRRPAPPHARRAVPAETQPSRDSTRVLEENVRELLHRLQLDLRSPAPEPAAAVAAAAPAPAHVPSAQELDAVLAIWRAKRGE